MLPTPPYDANTRKPFVHGLLPPMQAFSVAQSQHPYEPARYEEYALSRQYRASASTAPPLPPPVYQQEHQSYAASMPSTGYAHQSSFGYGLGTAPVLPPIQGPDRSIADQQQSRSNCVSAAPQKQPKEEKVGGVAAHLDYKMDEMVEFVSQMSQGMYGIFRSKICLADIDMIRSVVNTKSAVPPEFRRYVSQVLTSTRLPSSTILLGLHYLAVRMTILSSRGDYHFGGGDVYSLLTTALLLGSKFLDDNTFQNRSWSDVSNISVKKLNRYETEWLQDINWDMHFDVSDPKGFALWLRRWQTFQTAVPGKNIDVLVDTLKKTSLDGSFNQQHASFQPISSNCHYASHFSEIAPMGQYAEKSSRQWQEPHNDNWRYVHPNSEYSPPSAPETGPTTPEYALSSDFTYGAMPQNYPSLKMPAPLHVLPSNAPSQGYLTPQYEQYDGHSNYCGCNYCMPYSERSSINYVFGQTVTV